MILFLFLFLFVTSCNNTSVIDYSQYTDNYSVADFDSTYVFSEDGNLGRKTVYLNIHCTATKEGVNLKGDWFLNFFKNDRKWDRPGYNEIVELDGHRFKSVPYDLDGYTTWNEVSYGVKGVNSVSINIAYVGGVDKYMRPKDTRTPYQIGAIDDIVREVKAAMPDVIVMGHREHRGVNKACPSFDVHKEYGDINPIINETKEFDFLPDEYKVDSLK